MRRFTQIIVMAGLATAVLAGSAAAEDLRSPDARVTTPVARPTIDLRSPDAKASKRLGATLSSDVAKGNVLRDLRSPDARAGDGVTTYTPGATATRRVSSIPANGFQWGDAGIDAVAMLGLIAVGGGVLLAVSSHRRGRRLPRATG